MGDFSDKRVVISGASRGIGLAIAKRLAAGGASIAILAKTAEPHPNCRVLSIPPPRRLSRLAARRYH